VEIAQPDLDKLAFSRVREALSDRTSTFRGGERALSLVPLDNLGAIERALDRVEEVVTGEPLSLGGVSNIRPLLNRVTDGGILDGTEILEVAYTMEAAGTIRRSILASQRVSLSELVARLGTFDGAVRLVHELIDTEGKVRDNATPKMRSIRRRLNPLRRSIRERLQGLLSTYSTHVQDPVITIRRGRYVIPVKSSSQAHVPGIVLDLSDSGVTVFIEPEAVVQMNNELALLQFEERDEERRIFVELSQRLAWEPEINESLEILAELDLIEASARLVGDWDLARPYLNDEARFRLEGGRHPLIEGCVGNSINLNEDLRLLILTGPNAGGKTVLLKTLGLAAVMAHAGLFVAAKATPVPELPHLDTILMDIGDEQSIEASLSTYAGHLTNLKEILERADDRVLVLIDELGSGTDPSEGAALSQSILEQILDTGARGLVTTHLAPLKVFASETAGTINAAMNFDLDRLRPTYQLVMGQPGRSYALAIAERLGIPLGLLERASEILGPDGERLEVLLAALEEQRADLQLDITEAQVVRDQARKEAEALRSQIENLRAREAQVLKAAAERAGKMLKETMQHAKALRRTATTDIEKRGNALDALQDLRRSTKIRAEAGRNLSNSSATQKLVLGANVFVEPYGAQGKIVERRGEQLVVQLGLLKVEVGAGDVRPVKNEAAKEVEDTAVYFGKQVNELNIRGERVELGIEKVRDFILESYSLKIDRVRVLHGKGTGSLREAVRNYLKLEKRVRRFEDAIPYEGGHGVTVVYLKL
jgi:DNA mismatch repair protein MutS2